MSVKTHIYGHVGPCLKVRNRILPRRSCPHFQLHLVQEIEAIGFPTKLVDCRNTFAHIDMSWMNFRFILQSCLKSRYDLFAN